jgi:hypothetical protein
MDGRYWSSPQGECDTDGLTKITQSSKGVENIKADVASETSTPKKRKPRENMNPLPFRTKSLRVQKGS